MADESHHSLRGIDGSLPPLSRVAAALGISEHEARAIYARALQKLAVYAEIQAGLLGYESVQDWAASGDPRWARILAYDEKAGEWRVRIDRREMEE